MSTQLSTEMNTVTATPLYVPQPHEETTREPAAPIASALSLDEVITALRTLQAQYQSLRAAEQILLHIVDAKDNIAALERRKLSLLDEISKLEQRRESALANAIAAEQAAKVRLEAIETQIRREEDRLSTERKKLEEDLSYLRTVINKLTLTASELKL
jgi:DNA repair exonuclease SbcCD ATPase subunit